MRLSSVATFRWHVDATNSVEGFTYSIRFNFINFHIYVAKQIPFCHVPFCWWYFVHYGFCFNTRNSELAQDHTLLMEEGKVSQKWRVKLSSILWTFVWKRIDCSEIFWTKVNPNKKRPQFNEFTSLAWKGRVEVEISSWLEETEFCWTSRWLRLNLLWCVSSKYGCNTTLRARVHIQLRSGINPRSLLNMCLWYFLQSCVLMLAWWTCDVH